MTNPRTMLSFLHGSRRFNFRVAGVALRDNHVLVCREDDDDYVMLPGGRVELGEPSAKALQREIAEELQCDGAVGPLLFAAENFFSRNGEQFHEIGLYYAIALPETFPFVTGASARVTHDEGHRLQFDWVKAGAGALRALNLLPEWIRARLDALPGSAEHLIIDEL